MHFAWHEQSGIVWLGLGPANPEPGGAARHAPGTPSGTGGAVRGGLSARSGGVSPHPWDSLNLGRRTGDRPDRIAENLERLARATGVDLTRAARIPLEHGARVRRVSAPGWADPGDALVTTVPGLPLAVTVADCFPVFLALPGAVAVAHCGWRGVAAAAAPAALASLCEAAGHPAAEALAWIGPGIGPCCYDLSAESARELPADALVHSPRAVDARRAVDLAAGLRAQLIDAGLSRASIATSGLCTACHPQHFFSHRRDRGRTGRMIAWIELASESRGELG